MDKKKKTISPFSIIRIVVIVIALGVSAFAIYKLNNIRKDYREVVELYEDIAAQVIETLPHVEPDPTAERKVSPSLKVDFDKLLAIQPNVVGWVEVPTCKISYPIVQGKDNDFYLDHAYDDTESYGGAVFLDCYAAKDWSYQHNIVYAHNMKNGSMFHDLLSYDSADYYKRYDGKNYFFIYTPNDVKIYQIFCVTDVSYKNNYNAYIININSSFTIFDYADYVRSVQLYDTGVVFNGQPVVSLYTCQIDSSSDIRHMVHGMLVETIPYESASDK